MQFQTPAPSPERHRYLLILLGLAIALLVYRAAIISHLESLLFYDEAYYYGWSLTPDWGYYSKPPVVAWIIWISTHLLGDSALGIKLGGSVLYTLAAGLIYLCSERLSGSKPAFYAALLFLTLPLISFNSLFITTDAPLIFFWTLALYGFLRAVESNSWRWWLLAGVAGGLGLLSKYTFILFPVTFLGFALLSSSGRQILANSRFWLACFLALSCLLPNLYWNYQHDFISFQHTAQISKQSENSADFGRMLEFWGQQLIVFTPVLFTLLFASLGRKKIPSTDASKLLWCLFIPTFLVISLQALLARANMNWAAPAYVAGVMLAGYYLQYWSKLWLGVALAFNLIFMAGFYHYGQIAQRLDIQLKRSTDPYSRVKGWPELVTRFQPYFAQYPDLPLAGNSRSLLTYFGYYLEPKQMNAHYLDGTEFIDDHYELMYPVATNQTYLFVTDDWHKAQLQGYFSEVQLLAEESLPLYPKLVRHARLYKVSGLKLAVKKP